MTTVESNHFTHFTSILAILNKDTRLGPSWLLLYVSLSV